jgi:signal transduction histidine kinase
MKGRGTITISASRTPRHVVIIVSDTGPGIKSSLLETIFDLGYTTKKGVRRKGMGFGFGLFYARQIVEDYEGRLKATSRLPLTDKRSAF